jgi:NAD(P)H-hydrate epimerase
MKLATTLQIRAMDRAAIELFGMPGIVLMENAVLAALERIEKRWTPLENLRIAVVCGKGNNGGDGLALARQLVARHNANVIVWLAENPDDSKSEEFKLNLEMARRFNITIRPVDGWDLFESEIASSDLIIDAILGTGLSGDPKPAAARAIRAINSAQKTVVSLDIPSGLNCDTGKAGDPTVKADLTITFGFSKPGLYLYPGVDFAGETDVVEIGYPKQVRTMQELKIQLSEASDIAPWIASRKSTRDTNKGQYKKVALFAGSPGFVGAACLSALGAARAGAGLVTLGVPKTIFDTVMSRINETIMSNPLSDTPIGTFSSAALKSALVQCESCDAAAIGPGITAIDGSTREFVQRFTRECPIPLVLDADALNALSTLPDRGVSSISSRTAPTLLTPHPGELGRMLGCETHEIQENRLGKVRIAAEQFGATVLLKGSRTLIANPDGKLAINTTGNSVLSIGGSGDLLTGIALTLIAQSGKSWESGAAAAYLHGLAADIMATKIGPAGLLASEIAAGIPEAIGTLLSEKS